MRGTQDLYGFTGTLTQLYRLLQDDMFQELFWAQLHLEAEPNMDAAIRMNEIVLKHRGKPCVNMWHDEFARVSTQGKLNADTVLYASI